MTFLLIRPDSWNLPLFVHVAGAMAVTAAVVVAVGALVLAWRASGEERAAITAFGFRTLLYAGIPAYFVMRIGAEWILSKENIPTDNEPGWVGTGYATADLGGILILIATILTGLGMRRLRAGRRRRRDGEGRHRARHLGRRAVPRRDLGDDHEAELALARSTQLSSSGRTLGEGSENDLGGVVEYSFEQWVNRLVHAHPLVGSVVVEFSNWGVALFGVLAVGLWLLSPPGDTRWKRACAAGLSGGRARPPSQSGHLARLGSGPAV